jgi:hypothetical protein
MPFRIFGTQWFDSDRALADGFLVRRSGVIPPDLVPVCPRSELPGDVTSQRDRSPTGDPPAHPFARPPLIRPGQSGSGSAVPTLAPRRDGSLPAVLPLVREGRGWG